MNTWISEQSKNIFAIFLISGLISHCAGGLIEYSSFSDDDIMLEMQMFNELDNVFNECMKEDPGSKTYQLASWYVEDTFRAEKESPHKPNEMYSHLKMEFLCFGIRKNFSDATKYEYENMAQYLGFWALKILAADNALTFTNGYIKNRDGNPALAQNCLFTARYLATFAGDTHWFSFSEPVPEIVKRNVHSGELAYLTAVIVRHVFETKIITDIREGIVHGYQQETKSFDEKELNERMKYIKVELPLVKLYLAITIFGLGNHMIEKRESRSDAPLWEAARSFIHPTKEDLVKYELPETNTYWYSYEREKTQDPSFINLLNNLDRHLKSEVSIKDEESWELAGKIATLIKSESTSSGNEPNNGRFKSKLVEIIWLLEKKRAIPRYKGDEESFEKSALGFGGGSGLTMKHGPGGDNPIGFYFTKK